MKRDPIVPIVLVKKRRKVQVHGPESCGGEGLMPPALLPSHSCADSPRHAGKSAELVNKVLVVDTLPMF